MPIFFYKFSKNIVATTKLQFFQISGIFPTCLGYFLSANTNRPKTRWFTKVLLSLIFAVLKASNECACHRDQDKTSNLRDWDSKNGKSRGQEQISRLHHCLTRSRETSILCSTCNVHRCLNQWRSLETHFCESWSWRFQVSSQSRRLQISRLWILQFNDFLFVVFAGKKQSKHVGKCQKLKKVNSEVMTTFKTKFWQNAQILKSRVSVSTFKSRVSEFLMKSRSRSFNQVSASKITL